MQFPILSVIALLPIIAGAIIVFIPTDRRNAIRYMALATSILTLVLSLIAFLSYDQQLAGYQFVERYEWIPLLGISFHVGVDGMNLPLVLLTGIVMFTGVLISWNL